MPGGVPWLPLLRGPWVRQSGGGLLAAPRDRSIQPLPRQRRQLLLQRRQCVVLTATRSEHGPAAAQTGAGSATETSASARSQVAAAIGLFPDVVLLPRGRSGHFLLRPERRTRRPTHAAAGEFQSANRAEPGGGAGAVSEGGESAAPRPCL